jgi:SAM-dependent methyltransferase
MEAEAYENMANVQSQHWWYVGRRKVIEKLFGFTHINGDASILEVGCGPGGNLKLLSCFGRVSAMEVDSYAAEIARSKNIAEVKEGALPDAIPFQQDSFDIVCLFDVVEHIERDKEALISIKPYLKGDGKILITVPAYQWMFGSHDRYNHHYRRYGSKSLKKLLNETGYIVEYNTYFNTLLFPLAVFVRLLERLRGKGVVAGQEVPVSPVNNMLAKIFSFEAKGLNYFRFPFGLSIAVIAKKI